MGQATKASLSRVLLLSMAVTIISGSAGLADDDEFVRPRMVSHTRYDGISDDLLTAGLGKSGLGTAIPPAVSSPPTAKELRRLAIYNNYRGLVDPTPGGGYGVLYGPNVTIEGVATGSEGLIPGDEYIAFASNGPGRKNVTMMVQVPDSFDPAKSCIVAAPSSGSRGVYGAIATAGEWGLKHGCAVAYTDKGTGPGAHDLQNNTVNLLRGERADAATAGDESTFTADLNPPELAAFNQATPNRFAFKHAHSRQNPEKDWGRNVLDSIRFAFYVLDQKYASQHGRPTITKRNTIVIASSVSNGGGASVRAVEQDEERLIDGVAVGEPNVNPVDDRSFWIIQDGRPPLHKHSRPLIDYIALVNVFQGCANLAPANAGAPLNLAGTADRCTNLKAKGLLSSTTLAPR
jgi:hydroxybutyrate-dimer hydrolase